jgi:hypothetical protein
VNGYGPNVDIPSYEEAEKDVHDTYPCSFNDPCPACVRKYSR